LQDSVFKKWVDTYAKDNDKFFEDFSKVITKLFELGVPFRGISPQVAFADNRRRQTPHAQKDRKRSGIIATAPNMNRSRHFGS
jgi:catalase (peroxidase I)